AASLCVLVPFLALGPSALLAYLPRVAGFGSPGGQPAATSLLLFAAVFLLTYGAARVLRPREFVHPFWHLAIAAFLAHTVALWNEHFRDYTLMFILPGLLGLA